MLRQSDAGERAVVNKPNDSRCGEIGEIVSLHYVVDTGEVLSALVTFDDDSTGMYFPQDILVLRDMDDAEVFE